MCRENPISPPVRKKTRDLIKAMRNSDPISHTQRIEQLEEWLRRDELAQLETFPFPGERF